MPITEVMAIGLETSDDDVVEAGLVALPGDQATAPHRSAAQHELPRVADAWALKTKSVSSPSNRGGS
jgi:hypothetical protein